MSIASATYLKKNLNASRPSERPPVRGGKMSKRSGSPEILEAGYDGSSVRARRADPTRTVIIVGMPGIGKSNLANRLLDHPVNDPFEEGKGTTTTTHIKRVEFNDLVVVDTPGMPNKDPHKTVVYFDAVVQAMRREASLSTLLFLVKQEFACPLEFKQYFVLLEQFNHIPCSKLMVCRQPALSRKSRKTEAEKRYEGAKYVERVLEASRLNMPLMLLTDGYGNESLQQVEEIVNFVLRSERVRVDAPTCRTSEELKHFVSRLADRATRLETLKQDVEEAEMSLWNRTLWMASQVVPLAYLSVASVGAGILWTGPYVKREQETCAELRVAIMKKKKELERGVVDDEGLQAARNVLSVLEDFSRNL